MKLSYFASLFSLLVASTLANPIPSPEKTHDYEIISSRSLTAAEKEAAFVKVSAVVPQILALNQLYAFTMSFKKKEDPNFPDMNKLTETIGGSHVALMVGAAISAHQFEGIVYDIQFPAGFKATPANTNGATVSMEKEDYKSSSLALKYLGPVSPRQTQDRIKAAGKKGLLVIFISHFRWTNFD